MTLKIPPLFWGRFLSDTEGTQGVLCSALVRSFLPVSACEGLPALYCKSLQSKRRPLEACFICLIRSYVAQCLTRGRHLINYFTQ